MICKGFCKMLVLGKKFCKEVCIINLTPILTMTQELDGLYDRFNRADQENKRKIGKYLHDKPGQWTARQELVEEFDIDESGITRHLDTLHEEGFLTSKFMDDQRYVQWEGRGAGGIEYWMRQAIPNQLWAAGNELRPLLTLESLGGAYVPTLLFGGLVVTGFLTAISAVLISYLPSNSIFGLTVVDLVIVTGLITVLASILFILIPFARLLEIAIFRAWSIGARLAQDRKS